VIVEGIQGVGGVNVPGKSFLRKLRSACDKYGALLIVDEIQSGYGRSGKFFAHQHAEVFPDLITVAKGMGNGFPVAAVMIHPDIKPIHGMLGTTFGGNYLACTASIEVLNVIEKEQLVKNAKEMGEYLLSELKSIEGIREVRGLGLMVGIELEYPCAGIRNELLHKYKIFTGSSSDKNTLRILPALTVKKAELDIFLNAFKDILSKTNWS
jgi:acetylornithine aminotransferase